MKFFKPEDFDNKDFKRIDGFDWMHAAAHYANAKLEREGVISFGARYKDARGWAFDQRSLPETTHKCMIICIEEITPCTHTDYLQYTKITCDGPEYLRAYCIKCQKNFKLQEIK